MPNSSTKHKHNGVEILVKGTVQGVGFRPFIYNLASRFSLQGTVSNTDKGVIILAAGQNDRLNTFVASIQNEAPPLATISSISTRPAFFELPDSGFSIIASSSAGAASTAIPPDIGLCIDCLRELNDHLDRRFHYPFTNCTNCGPRFSIVETIPYDRPKTSMKVFPMCASCSAEYHDPTNRRFHAQPNACAHCGPSVTLHDNSGKTIQSDDCIADAATFLGVDKIVALRGLGGFHLSANGLSEKAVELLRSRKGRPDKPLAVMIPDLETVRRYCIVSKDQEKILLSPQKPIVLLAKRSDSDLAPNLAPGISEIGVMLPYTPLHHLLFVSPDCPEVLVMTSGNVSSSPICTGNADALSKLSAIADYFLLHNRDIVTRVDDSVIRVYSGSSLLLRRARGYVPSPVEVPWEMPHILGCGGGLKSTFCLARGNSLFVSQHIGDLDNLETYDFFVESVEHMKKMLQIEPVAVACDLHPDYLSSRYATEQDLPLYKFQHHYAHAAAVIAEHSIEDEVLAVVLDGTGLGTDGTIWGGEILQADLKGFQRLGHLQNLQLPGGDAAAMEPWRMGLASLYATFGEAGIARETLPPALTQIAPGSVRIIQTMLSNNFNSPLTSSCGRLFDAVASLLDVRQTMSFEGQAAMELESVARKVFQQKTASHLDTLPFSHSKFSRFIKEKDGKWEISSTEFVKIVFESLSRGEPISSIAFQFHLNLIGSLTFLLSRLSEQTSIRKVVLAGGCMQNTLLLEGLFRSLAAINLKVYTGNKFPVNDGAISLGQTLIGGLKHVSRNTHEGDRSYR